MIIQTKFKGKTQQIDTFLSEIESGYANLKASILKAYELKAYKQRFRNYRKIPRLNYVEYTARQEKTVLRNRELEINVRRLEKEAEFKLRQEKEKEKIRKEEEWKLRLEREKKKRIRDGESQNRYEVPIQES